VIIDRFKIGLFEMPNIKSSHDMALWLIIMKKGFIAYGLNQVLASYRIVPNSNTARKKNAVRFVWRVYRDFENMSVTKSAIYFTLYSFNAIRKRL